MSVRVDRTDNRAARRALRPKRHAHDRNRCAPIERLRSTAHLILTGRAAICLTHIENAPLTATMELSRNHGSQQGGALMKSSTKYVGLDVHQATAVTSDRAEGGREIARTVLPSVATPIVGYCRG